LWLAGLVSFLGTWVHNVAARWTAATLSTEPLAVSSVDALQLAPMVLLSLFAGQLADATDRRRLLVATHAGLAVVVAIMGVLATLDLLSLPVLLGLTGLLGVLGALNGPAWQATVPRQVPEEDVPKAVALMSTGFNLARAVGPAAGAWMLVAVGPAAAFFTNAASYLVIGLLLWRLPAQPPPENHGPVRSPLSEPGLVRLYVVGLAFGLFAMPSLSLLPVVARDALHGDAAVYGDLLSAFGLGAVSAGLVVASAVRRFGNRPFIALTTVASAIGLAMLASAHTLPFALAASAVSGMGWIGTISTVNAGVQMRAPAEVRARALAYYLTFAVGGQASGSLLGGWMAGHLGLELALRISAAALVVVAIVVLAGYRRRPVAPDGTSPTPEAT
jgi:MFS family permease